MRLGKRVLSPEEYERQRARGIGTDAAAFRLGPRVAKHVEVHMPPTQDVKQAASQDVPAPTGIAKARAAKAAKAAAAKGK